MAVTFAWRSDTSTGDARHALGSNQMAVLGSSHTYQTNTAALGGFAWGMSSAQNGGLSFHGHGNLQLGLTAACSFLVRFQPNYSSGFNTALFNMQNSSNLGRFIWRHQVSQQVNVDFVDYTNLNHFTNDIGAMNVTTTSFHDFVCTFRTDTTSGNNIQMYFDGLTLGTRDFFNTTGFAGADYIFNQFGISSNWNIGNVYLNINEIVIWNEVINPTSVNLVDPSSGTTSTAQSLNGASRTGWVDVSSRNGLAWDSIAASDIRSGVEQIQSGLTQTGTFSGEVWTTIAASDIRSGVEQIQNSTTITGTLVVPTAVAGTATTINIPDIKNQIQFVLDQNNTTTSTIHDLSGSLSQRVKQIFKVNPDNIRIDQDNIPYVTIFTDSKTISPKTIARDAVNGKREAKLTFDIVGCVWNQNWQTDVYNDPADDDLERLMENTEKILRHYTTLNSNVKWHFPSSVTYDNANLAEETHLRVGYMSLEATILY